MSVALADSWLERLLDAEERAARAGGDRRSFALQHTGGMERQLDHPGWDDSWPVPTEHDVDDLCEHGWARLDGPIGGKNRLFSLTSAGRLRGQRAHRARVGLQGPPVSLDWDLLDPALEAALAAYEQAGAPDGGIAVASIPLPPEVSRAAIAELSRAALLIDCEAEIGASSGVDQIEGPSFVRPSLDALRLRRGWPQGAADAAVQRLAGALLAAAEASDDHEEQTRLRRAAEWLGRFGTGVLTGVATGQAGHLLS